MSTARVISRLCTRLYGSMSKTARWLHQQVALIGACLGQKFLLNSATRRRVRLAVFWAKEKTQGKSWRATNGSGRCDGGGTPGVHAHSSARVAANSQQLRIRIIFKNYQSPGLQLDRSVQWARKGWALGIYRSSPSLSAQRQESQACFSKHFSLQANAKLERHNLVNRPGGSLSSELFKITRLLKNHFHMMSNSDFPVFSNTNDREFFTIDDTWNVLSAIT